MSLFCAYAGMGKTTLASKYSNVEDPETLLFQWIYDDPHKNLTYKKLKGCNDIRVAEPDEMLFLLPPPLGLCLKV